MVQSPQSEISLQSFLMSRFVCFFFFIRNTHTCFETRIQNADSNTSLEGYDMKKRDYLKTKEKKKKT